MTPPAHSASVWLGARVSWVACGGGRFYEESVAPLVFVLGLATLSRTLFAYILGSRGSNMGPILVNFGVGVYPRTLWAPTQSDPGTPPLDPAAPFYAILVPNWVPNGVPKWSPNGETFSPQINATINVILDGPLERLWSTLGAVGTLDPRKLVFRFSEVLIFKESFCACLD